MKKARMKQADSERVVDKPQATFGRMRENAESGRVSPT